jgi:hypothetical protein
MRTYAAAAGRAEVHHAGRWRAGAAQFGQPAREARGGIDLADAGVQHLGAGAFEQAAGFLRQCHDYQGFHHLGR